LEHSLCCNAIHSGTDRAGRRAGARLWNRPSHFRTACLATVSGSSGAETRFRRALTEAYHSARLGTRSGPRHAADRPGQQVGGSVEIRILLRAVGVGHLAVSAIRFVPGERQR
jgi:hypothetical protein